MKFEKPKAAEGSNVERDIEHARMRVIYENPSEYADWRRRMGLEKPFDGPINHEMRQRVIGTFAKLMADMHHRDAKRPAWRPEARRLTLDELAADYAANPITISSEALKPKGEAA